MLNVIDTRVIEHILKLINIFNKLKDRDMPLP
jgi:hypothetical protein